MRDLRSRIVRHVTWPFYIERDAPGSRREWNALETSQSWPAERLNALRGARLAALLEHARVHVPFYRARMAAAGVDAGAASGDPAAALAALQPLEKSDIQERRMAMRADNIPASELIENRTGGSTGSPLVFDLDRARSASRYAAALRANRWAGWEPGDPVAALWGASRDVAAPRNLRERLRADWCDRMETLNAARVTESDVAGFLTRLRAARPRVILGYARMLKLLAQAARAGVGNGAGGAGGPAIPGLVSLVSSAEVLEPGDRLEIEAGLGVPVFDRYGAREVSTIAAECERHEGLHLNAENLWIEVVDARGRPVPDGTPGILLVTDLRNLGMPLIRYRIGDMAALLPGSCPCGRTLPRLSGITGRVTDFLLLPDGTRISGAALTIVMVAELANVRQVQLYQPRREEVHIRVVPGPGFDAGTEAEILRRAKDKLGPTVAIRVVRVDEIVPEPSGKHRFSISEAV